MKKNNLSINKRGSVLILIILAIIVVSALAVGMSKISSISTLNQLEFNQANLARNLAYSGVEYAKGLALSYKNQSKTIDQLVSALNSGGTNSTSTYSVGGAIGYFTLNVTKLSNTTFSVACTGYTPSGVWQAAFSLPNTVTLTYSSPTWSGGDYVVNSGSDLTISQPSTINGNISGKSVSFNYQATIYGNVISQTYASISQASVVHGQVCAASGDVTLAYGAEVTDDVKANGNITINQSAVADTNAYATKNIYMGYQSTIKKTGQAGGSIGGINNNTVYTIGTKLPYTMPTVTCPTASAPTATTISCSGTKAPGTSSISSPLSPGQYTDLNIAQGASVYLTSGTYNFSSITTNYQSNIYLDISSGNDLTVLSCGDIYIDQETAVYVKTTTSGSYVLAKDATPHSDAAHVYFGTNTNFTTKKYINSSWFGTIYALKTLSVGQNFTLTGTLATPGTLSIGYNLSVLEYILANYAKANWK